MNQNPQNSIEDIYPLSPLQEGILFHSLLAPKSGIYFGQIVVSLEGDLDAVAFERAWQRVVDRHPALRTCFVWEGREKPLQVVLPRVALRLTQHDWRGLSPVEQHQQLESLRQAEQAQGFNLSKTPLMRLILIRVAEDSYELIWSFHSLLMDGWSMFLVLTEVLAFYEAFHRGQDLDLPLPRPFRDYIAWHKRQDRAAAEAFWRQRLGDFTAPTPLVVDRPLGNLPVEAEPFETQHVRLDAATTAALNALARQHRLTLNTIVQGAWALLLSRYSGESVVVFGAAVSGRPATLEGVESMIGFFINTLPVLVRLSPQDELLPWLQHLQQEQLRMRQYEYSSLVDVQGCSGVPRGRPLFESILLFENYRKDAPLEAMGRSLRLHNLRWVERTNYPLMALAVPESQLLLSLTYQCRRFDSSTIRRMLGHWQTVLEGMVANPQCRLRDVPLLTPAEQHQLLVRWNDTCSSYPHDQCLHDLFDAQVERTPEAVAVVFEDQHVTFRELNRRADRLAHHLRALGVGPEALVGICLERSLEMMVALLGVLKAGGAYVPLDPTFPPERLAFMLEDAQVSVLLVQTHLLEKLPRHQVHVICLDQWMVNQSMSQRVGNSIDSLTHLLTDSCAGGVTADNLAYVIYTSGSTGKPKGVQISHRALVNFLAAMQQQPGLNQRDVLLSVTTLSFDIAGLELYLPLLVGARLVLVGQEVTRDGQQLAAWLSWSQATVMQATPALWQMLVETDWAGCPHLKMLAGGEALPRELAERLLAKGASLWNMYGPTETTIWSTTHEVLSQDGAVPIGRPIANTQLYVLDDELRPMPVGVPGTLYIGGDGLARGYLKRPDLTAEKFIPDPFGGQSGARLYNTGDLARYRPDGDVEFLGRRDHQVKIRGYRIELGEIEATLRQHPAVRQAVVLGREDVPGDKRLVAYIIPRQERPPSSDELRMFLLQKLPEYMVPQTFLLLNALPLTPNGKVDRRALPAPEGERPALTAAYVAPRTEVERTIAAVWQEVLRIENVGTQDNFFDLGGHSLLLTQVYSKLRRITHRDLSMLDLFRYPTISALADYLSQEPSEPPSFQPIQDRAQIRRASLKRRRPWRQPGQ